MSGITLTEATHGDWHLVYAAGSVDAATSDTLLTALEGALAAHPHVAVDCSAVDYVSSAGLAVFMTAARVARAASREFAVCRPSPRVRQLLDISRLQTALTVLTDLPS